MAKIADIKLNLCESVDNATFTKIVFCLCRYTNNQIGVYRMTAEDSFDTNYRYNVYIDGSNEHMKRKPVKAEINNIEQFINGIIYTMKSF